MLSVSFKQNESSVIIVNCKLGSVYIIQATKFKLRISNLTTVNFVGICV